MPPKEKGKIVVMIVDDSNLMRTMLCEALEQIPEISVIAQASNGRLALPRIKYFKPDIVLLDQEMPEMDGLETLKNLQDEVPESKVIMFSAHTFEGAETTMKALELGAVDFLAKPSPDKAADFETFVRLQLIPKIIAIAGTQNRPLPAKHLLPAVEAALPKLPKHCDICAIGISTGGPNALRVIIPTLPANLDGAVLIVQHMPENFTKALADSLGQVSKLSVSEAIHGETVRKGHVYIAPGGRHMTAKQSADAILIQINDQEPDGNCRPSVNYLFESLAGLKSPERVLSIIMTGMGHDGARGMEILKKAGASLAAQSKESSLIYGMPAKPIESGLVTAIGDLGYLRDLIISSLGTTHG